MTKICRLSRADFSSLKTLYRAQGAIFTLTVSKSPDSKARFACVVSKKTARRAHERNLIKRRCRAAVREAALVPPFAYVFTAKRAAQEAQHNTVLAEVRSLLVKANASLKSTPELQ